MPETKKDSIFWHLMETGAHQGAFNMAVDEVLASGSMRQNPVLRFFGWQPYAISLGYHQDRDDIDVDKCERDGIDVVRRPTGGRAILHSEEVTYSVVVPRGHDLFEVSASKLYNLISCALVTGLQELDTDIVLHRNRKASHDFALYREKFACFATVAKHEVTFGSKKVVGSAQRRYQNGVLQHGSILLGNGHLKLAEYVRRSRRDQIRATLDRRTISLSDITRRIIDFEEVMMHLMNGFEKTFDIKLVTDSLTQKELDVIYDIKPKFTN